MNAALFSDPLLKVAIMAALEAGRKIMEIYADDDYGVELKGDASPLTFADKAAHEVIMQALRQTGLPVLSEEGPEISYAERSEWERFWMVDPLDGTKEFISRNGEFTVNIALIEQGCPVLGAVYVPVIDELYIGQDGKGALLIRAAASEACAAVSLPYGAGAEADSVYRVVGSRSHLNEETLAFIEGLRTEHPEIEIVQRGSSLKICMVAAGDADIYPRFGPTMEWDTAAGHAVVRAAGKRLVVAGSGDEVQYNKEHLLNPSFVVQ